MYSWSSSTPSLVSVVVAKGSCQLEGFYHISTAFLSFSIRDARVLPRRSSDTGYKHQFLDLIYNGVQLETAMTARMFILQRPAYYVLCDWSTRGRGWKHV